MAIFLRSHNAFRAALTHIVILQNPTLHTPFRSMTKNQCCRGVASDDGIIMLNGFDAVFGGGRQLARRRRDTPASGRVGFASGKPPGADGGAKVAHGRARRALLKGLKEFMEMPFGHVADWLRSGLQNRLPRFNSGRGLHKINELVRRSFEKRSSASGSSIECRAVFRRLPRRPPSLRLKNVADRTSASAAQERPPSRH